jgi:acyl-CoA hydrolase
MVPTDANFMGNVFGGQMLMEIDKVAYVAATRHSSRTCVTASFDRVDFLRPVYVGQVVEFDAWLTYVGRSSMEIAIEARAEPLLGGPSYHVVHAWVTMVAVGDDGQPVEVPPLQLETEAERAEFAAGRRRMEARKRTRNADAPPRAPGATAPPVAGQ